MIARVPQIWTVGENLRRFLRAGGGVPAALAIGGFCLLLASLLMAFRSRWVARWGVAAFVCFGIAFLFALLETLRALLPSRLTPRTTAWIRRVILVAGIFLVLVGRESSVTRGSTDPRVPSNVRPNADLIQFASTFATAKRAAFNLDGPPALRAPPGKSIDQTIEFHVLREGRYRLAAQITDGPFVQQEQRASDYLETITADRSVEQTFRVGQGATAFGGIRVKVQARSIINNLPATRAPDAPLTATLFRLDSTGGRERLGSVSLPSKEGGLDDAWRAVVFPFLVDLAGQSSRAFEVEFSSPSSIIGWAIARATTGFLKIDDHYPDGSLFANGKRFPRDTSGDLEFAVLIRNAVTEPAHVFVDHTMLSLETIENEPSWQMAQPVHLAEGAHRLTVRSRNPHVSFFRFVFVQDREEARSVVVAKPSATSRLVPEPTPSSQEASASP